MSLHLLRAIKSFKIRHRPEEKINLRIGVHVGMLHICDFMGCSFSVKLPIDLSIRNYIFNVDRSVRGRCCWIEDAKILSVW